MKREIDIIVAGHTCLDIIPTMMRGRRYKVEELLSPGKLINVGAAAISTGGTVPNTGLALMRMKSHRWEKKQSSMEPG